MISILLLLTIVCHVVASQTLFGTQTFSTSLASQTALLGELGVQVVRLLVSWRQLEENGKSQYQSWYLNSMDEDIEAMTQMNVKIILQMAQTPCWASTSSNCSQLYYRPRNYSDYADTMVFLLNRYGDKISAWEIWNEPNIKRFWLRPECQANEGLCPRPADQNDEWLEFIDFVGAQEYSQLVKITSQKMRTISPNVSILAGSLAGSDVDYLNEMYQSGIRDFYTGLAMHPYTSYYPNGTSQYGKQYGPDECFPSTKASKFWCFQQGVERVRELMVQQMESAKSIWFTEFGFSSFAGWDGAGIQSQADYLGRAIDIIRNQWSFVHSACVYEYSDYGPTDDREGFFGLLYQNYTMKPSGLVFKEKMQHFLNR